MLVMAPLSFEHKVMALATATATMESSQTLIQTESRVQRSYQEVQVSEQRTVKKKTKSRRHKDEGNISVSKSSEKLFKKMKAADAESIPQCQKCSRPVYAMERIKAEKRIWHKECFRCVQCNKQLTVETYQSDHTTLYCKPHFKQLFEPKPVDDDDETDATVPKKHQMIICESNPVELPPDVVRASSKPELGLEQLSQLDVKSRFEVFERGAAPQQPPERAQAPREKTQAILSKLAKFKAKGMDVGVSDEYLNGVPIEASSSEPEEDEEDEDSVLKKSYKHTASREQPVSFCNMSEIVGKFETGQHSSSERHRERKQEIQNIRSRLFMGKQAKIKEMYEQSVLQSEQGVTSADKISRELDLNAEKARAIKERFENGEVFNDENQPPKNREIDDRALFNEGIGKKSRSIFLELDANAKSMPPTSPPPGDVPKRKEIPFVPKDVVRAADKLEDVKIETSDISDRFKFFETYRPETTRKEFRMTPPRQTQRAKSPSPEVYVEPSVSREGGAAGADAGAAAARHTAQRMISVFRQLEHQQAQPGDNQGPKPLKRFTPPPPGENNHQGQSSDEEYSSSEYEEEDSEDERRRVYLEARQRDEALKQAQQLARTKSFRDRFEHWSESEPQRSPSAVVIERQTEQDDDGESQLETAKSLRQKFENMNVTQSSVSKTFAPKVNRFV
ncbi:LIM domain and actin-binding protein 1 isoform X2 [Trichoplusia ni]|uniref:LIM domain and actin-binding protein 1 isoform X2 n=1 Tax=Trichoplusia ni TaxID=7111 RepID=A0A7E5VSC9_TRINI|nr:LIM domain and actin-binding protein 1 isoform X2 [Trichoplusia ni]